MSEEETEGLEPVTVVSRETWGALPPKGPLPAREGPAAHVVVHWGTDTDPCETSEECTKTMQAIQKTHMEEIGLDDIAFNFVIGGDGKAYTGRGWESAPSPTVYPHQDPLKRIDIAYIGRDWGRENIPWEMLKAALQVLSAGVDANLLDPDYDSLEHPVELMEGNAEE